jgi:hypothetical protein
VGDTSVEYRLDLNQQLLAAAILEEGRNSILSLRNSVPRSVKMGGAGAGELHHGGKPPSSMVPAWQSKCGRRALPLRPPIGPGESAG